VTTQRCEEAVKKTYIKVYLRYKDLLRRPIIA